MHPRRCGKCGQKAMEMATIPYSTTIAHDSRSYAVQLPALMVPRCQRCGEISLDEGADRQISEAFRRQARLLMPEDIRKGREGLGITQKLFAHLLGFGESTVCRWERGGQIQQRSHDLFMRLIFDGDVPLSSRNGEKRQPAGGFRTGVYRRFAPPVRPVGDKYPRETTGQGR